MDETYLRRLNNKIQFFRMAYLILFLLSLVLIVLKTPVSLWTTTLVMSIAIRLFISTPLIKRYRNALLEKAKENEHK